MKFNESMVGKRVRETDTGDEGVITRQGLVCETVYVQWDGSGEYWIHLEDVEFITKFVPDEITIDGVRYKLTKID